MFGSTTPQGIANSNTALTKFFVNGTLIQSYNTMTNVRSSFIVLGGNQQSSQTPASAYVGGFTIQWNRV
jgi:hypothetical protein